MKDQGNSQKARSKTSSLTADWIEHEDSHPISGIFFRAGGFLFFGYTFFYLGKSI
jgi:hypothetical protein